MADVTYHKRNFFNTAIADIYRAIDGKSLVGSFILTFCLIDYLTWLEFGQAKAGSLKKNYVDWVQKRLTPLSIFYTDKGEELYKVRCALVHNYGPMDPKYSGYELNFKSTGMHLQRVNTRTLKLCLYTMLTETVYAAHLFFEDLSLSGDSDTIGRLKQQIKIVGINPPESYKDMHRALSVFDSAKPVSLLDIQSDYSMKILWGQ